MPVPSSLADLSTVAGSNSPSGSETPGQGDDYLRVLSAFLAQIRDKLNGTSDTGTIKNPTVSGTLTWPATVTHNGDHTFSGAVLFNGNTSIGNATTDTLTIAPTAVTWGTTTTHSGAHVWSGAQTFNGAATFTGSFTAPGLPTSGTYTPTVSNGNANYVSSTPSVTGWMRVGDIVSVAGQLDVVSTAAGSTVALTLSLPVASTFSAATQLAGSFLVTSSTSNPGVPTFLRASTSPAGAVFQFAVSAVSASAVLHFTFTYQVI